LRGEADINGFRLFWRVQSALVGADCTNAVVVKAPQRSRPWSRVIHDSAGKTAAYVDLRELLYCDTRSPQVILTDDCRTVPG
jgi:hypothetical protein